MIKSFVAGSVITLAAMSSGDAITPPISTFGANGFYSVPATTVFKSGNTIELPDRSLMTSSVAFSDFWGQQASHIVLHKLLPNGQPDLTWQSSGKRDLRVLHGYSLNQFWTVKIAVVRTNYGFLAIEPTQAGVGGVWLQAVDNNGNDLYIFDGYPFKFIPATNVGWTDYIERFEVKNDTARNRIVVMGTYGEGGGSKRFIGSINYDGAPTPGFGSAGFVSEASPNYPSIVWSDFTTGDFIYIGGNIIDSSGDEESDITVTKLNGLTGSPIVSYGTGGTVRLNRAGREFKTRIETAGSKLLVVAGRGEPSYRIDSIDGTNGSVAVEPLYMITTVVRLNDNGTPDSTFGAAGWFDIQNPEYLQVVDIATPTPAFSGFGVNRLAFAAIGLEQGTPGMVGNIDVGLTASLTRIASSQCGPNGKDFPMRIDLGAFSTLFVGGSNTCPPIYHPVIAKHGAN